MAWAYWSKKKTSAPSLFFDLFSNGLGGFSFRKLLSSHTGRWGRAINITTLEERDINFVGDYCDTADLVDLSNGTDTVELMAYDNSFLSIYWTPDAARRPILVSSGTLVTLNGFAAADFPAIRRISMSTSNVSQVDISPVTVIALGKVDTYRQRNVSVGNTNTTFAYSHAGTLASYNGMNHYDGTNISSLSDEDLNRRVGYYSWDSTTLRIGANGSSLTDFTGRLGASSVRQIGCAAIATNQSFSGKIQEMLFFSTNKDSDYSSIMSNINGYYSIY